MSNPEYQAAKDAARANRSFYQAFEALDIEAMRRVWLDADHIRCVHPGWELLVGRERVLRSWEMIFKNTTEIRFDISDLEVRILAGCAWITAIENIHSCVEGSRFDAQAVVTNLFERRGDDYFLVLHHASPVAQRGFDELIEGLS